MKRKDAVKIMIRYTERKGLDSCMFKNMQSNGLTSHKCLFEESFTLTAAMGLGGGQTPIIISIT